MSLTNNSSSASVVRFYRSKDGGSVFKFEFMPEDDHLAIYCLTHPSLNGRDPNPRKTHLFDTGKVCFVAGREPTNQSRAEELAKQWAEYFLEYRRTGVAQN